MADDDWIVLRTSGRSTLALAKTLKQDGFDVWTPERRQTIRIARMNVRREIVIPLLPSFLFARSTHLHDLLRMEKMPMKTRIVVAHGEPQYHRDFHVFRYLDDIPMIADRHLEPLRTKEREAIPKKSRPRFDRGAGVRVNGGIFEGCEGRVERCQSGYALVIFTNWKRTAKIPTYLLAESPENSHI